MKKFVSLIFIGVLILISSSCEKSYSPWTSLDKNIQLQVWKYKLVNDVEGIIDIYKFKNGSLNTKILNTNKPKLISGWGRENSIFINGSYFHEDFTPSGFIMVDHKRIGKRDFDQDKTGLLIINNNKIEIRDTTENPFKLNDDFEYALQSYPFILKEGLKAISEDSGKKSRRTVIGIDKNDYVYIIISDSFNLSLFELADELKKTQIPFINVLNLDGGTSTGISVKLPKFQKIIDSMGSIPHGIEFMLNDKI